ncbi:MAG: SH3 domain-containing protein, partial [Anaerolineae bacterium]|nr:SH3 domain-containing protein [Anaerolineae bacterium]
LETVNVREGPGVTFSAIKALVPGTGVEILGQNDDGRWFNIKMEDGQEGWIAAQLVRVNPMPTLIPTSTPSPDLTALALGTPLPTAILGGGTVTPTPPRSVVSPTPPGTAVTESAGQETASGTLQLPVIDVNAIELTATALNANGITVPQPTATFTPLALPNQNTPASTQPAGTAATLPPVTLQAGEGSEGNTGSQQGVDVLAYCDNPVFGKPAPAGLKAGATIDIFWSWYTSEEELIQQHLDNVIYEVRIDDVLLDTWRLYKTRVRKQNDGNYYVYWFVPYGPLAAGPHKITYLVTWKTQITDGYDMYGPGTNRSSESGSCTFTVQ